ncbi:hypothetical protein [Nonomuraea sp. NPDC002799]
MKRLLAGLAGIIVLITAGAPAQAATFADPVKALKSRLVAGQGVEFTDVTTYVDLMAGKTAFLRRSGVLQYGKPVKGGMGVIVASDISATYTPHEGDIFKSLDLLLGDERTITIGKVSYTRGAKLLGDLPKGKRWFKVNRPLPGGFSGMYSQQVNPAEPATLQALIKAAQKKGRIYKGSISVARLWQVSPWYRAAAVSKGKAGDTVEYELTLGSDNLPQRLLTTHPAAEHWTESLVNDDLITIESRFTGWGNKMRVTPPSAAQIHTAKQR